MHSYSLTTSLLAVWASAFAVGIVAAWLMRLVSHKIGLVDRPDPTRKLHRGDIALGGGLGILFTLGVALLVTEHLISPNAPWGSFTWKFRWQTLAFASVMITLLGVIDDYRPLSGKAKLLGQVAITGFLAFNWQPSGIVTFFDWSLDIGAIAGLLLMFWLLISINSVNLIDGADGVTGSFGTVAAFGISVVAWLNGNVFACLVATILSAALMAFLWFNRPPASMFLGDAGSMLVGLLLGTLACIAVSEPGTPQNVLIPIALLGLPLIDSTAAVLRRVLTGRSILSGDRGHLHHLVAAQLTSRGYSPRWMIPIIGGLTLCTSTGAALGTILSSGLVAIASVGALVFVLVALRIFGHAEAKLVYAQTRRMGTRLLHPVRRTACQSHNSGVALQGNRQWEHVWQPLVEFAEINGLWRLRLDLNMPWLHEGYHGSWSRGELPEVEHQWSVRLPIVCRQRVVGRLDLVGKIEGTSQIESLESFSFLIAELQPEMEKLVCMLDDSTLFPASAPKALMLKGTAPNLRPVPSN
jgi:UDP-GlcNAc:undecaprenyl-phosphate GlcNAc-1-phosphate transferase